MDNTFFSGINGTVTGIVGLALAGVVVLAALILGAICGYRLYREYVDPVVEWKRGQFIRASGKTEGEWRRFRGGS